VLVYAGERPSRLANRDILGLSEDVQMLMEACWDQDPSIRPQVADTLARLEAASRGWVSPTPEAIANLSLGRPSSQNLPATGPVDTIPETGFGTTGSGAAGPRETR